MDIAARYTYVEESLHPLCSYRYRQHKAFSIIAYNANANQHPYYWFYTVSTEQNAISILCVDIFEKCKHGANLVHSRLIKPIECVFLYHLEWVKKGMV